MDSADLKQADEEWISKYRAALNNTPIKHSRSLEIRAAVDAGYSIFKSHCLSLLRTVAQCRYKVALKPSKPILLAPRPAVKERETPGPEERTVAS